MNRKIIQSLIMLLAIAVALQGFCFVKAQDSFSSKIEAADTAVGQAFEAVLDAERAGGDVSGLMAQLDSAARLLAEARIAYGTGAVEVADSKAANANAIAESVEASAASLKDAATVEGYNAFWLAVVLLVGGAVGVAVVLWLVWARFKRLYSQKLLSMKPEVVDGA